jgi:hypothetical protein
MRPRKWRRPGDHPAGETLLLFLEGELPARDGSAAAEHLKQCWSCRLHAEQLGRGIRRFMEYRHDLLHSRAAVPPRQGFSFRLNSVTKRNRLRPTLFQRKWPKRSGGLDSPFIGWAPMRVRTCVSSPMPGT